LKEGIEKEEVNSSRTVKDHVPIKER